MILTAEYYLSSISRKRWRIALDNEKQVKKLNDKKNSNSPI